MLKNKLRKVILAASVWLSLCPPVASAAGFLPSTETGAAGPTASKCGSPNGCGNYSLNDIMSVVIIISDWILGIVGSVALLFFIYGGFTFIFSGGNESTVKKGKDILINAIIGLALVFSSYIIIEFAAQALGIKASTGLNFKI